MKNLKEINEFRSNAKSELVWELLTQSKWTIKYMYNCEVISSFNKGDKIEWRGAFMDHNVFLTGEVLEIEQGKLLKYSIIDPALFDANVEANFLHVTYRLKENGAQTDLTVISESLNGDGERIKHAKQGWNDFIYPKIVAVLEKND